MIKKILFLSVLFYVTATAQSQECKLMPSEYDSLYYINAEDIKCLARSSTKKNIVVYTFGNWCTPCRLHLPNALALVEEYDIDLYVLVIENFSYPGMINTSIKYLNENKGTKTIIALKEEYGKKMRKQYKQFLTEVIPPGFKNINDMSKFIVYNQDGDVVMVTSYEDNEGNDWRDKSKVIKEKVIPHLTPVLK